MTIGKRFAWVLTLLGLAAFVISCGGDGDEIGAGGDGDGEEVEQPADVDAAGGGDQSPGPGPGPGPDGDDVKPDGDEPGGDPDPVVDGDGEPDLDADGDAVEGDGEGVNPVVEDLVETGIFWLENGEAELANQAFREAFDIAPNHPGARFGYAFSESMVGFEIMTGLILGALEGNLKSGFHPPSPDSDDPEDWNEWLDEEFFKAFELISERFRISVELYEPLKGETNLSMMFDKLPIYLGLQYPTYIKGEIDNTDVYIFDSMSRMFALALEFINAHQFKGDIGMVVNRIESDYWGGSIDAEVILPIIAFLLNSSEDFLSFRPDGLGLEKIDTSKDLLLVAMENLILAAGAAEAELDTEDDQDDDLFTIIYDRRTPKLMLNVYSEEQDPETGRDKKITMEFVAPEHIDAINSISKQIKNGGDPLPFDTDIMPVVASMAILPVGFGLLERFGIDLGLPYDIITPEVLTGLINGFVDLSIIALDLKAYYDDPLSLREMFPVWTSDQPRFENTLLMEWECPAETADDGLPNGSAKFFCVGDELEDLPHFVGTQYEFAADERPARSPYVAMQNPDFSGAFYVDMEALDLPDSSVEPQWQKADQRSFNAALAELLVGIVGLLK